ncbi:hypothetical protein [Pseudofrankia saprophytica]|uniref:hypothetical protein n=1 Tax=Pseudofrankia saprophytica TaxID=298655 RepID=UPI000685301C|nr:hypothetical protein [Pseudofrankia saprophytica]
MAVVTLTAGCANSSNPGGTTAASQQPTPMAASATPTTPAARDNATDLLDAQDRLRPEQVQQAWWTWATTPATGQVSPVDDPDGRACADRQPARVWFLAGTYGGDAARACTVPADRVFIVPLVNFRADTEADCQDLLAAAHGNATFDQQPLSPAAIEPTLLIEDGTQSFACGLWIAMNTIPAGNHRLSIDGNAGDFQTHVDYTLTALTPSSG